MNCLLRAADALPGNYNSSQPQHLFDSEKLGQGDADIATPRAAQYNNVNLFDSVILRLKWCLHLSGKAMLWVGTTPSQKIRKYQADDSTGAHLGRQAHRRKAHPLTSRRFWNPGLTACAGCLSIRWSSLSTYAQPCALTPCKRENSPNTTYNTTALKGECRRAQCFTPPQTRPACKYPHGTHQQSVQFDMLCCRR